MPLAWWHVWRRRSTCIAAFSPSSSSARTRPARLLGRDGASVAALAAKAILSHRKSLEVAHQQIRFRGHDFAFSSRITAQGELVIELDVGDPRLGDRIVLEEELRTAVRKVRGIAQAGPRRGR